MTGTSPTCLFENVINPSGVGQNITSLVFDVLNPGGMVTCKLINTINFKTCTTGPFDDGGAMVTFSNGSIPFQTDFSLQFTGLQSAIKLVLMYNTVNWAPHEVPLSM